MNSKYCMINLMADIISLDDKYTGKKLNCNDICDVFASMDKIENKKVRNILNNVDKTTFQNWIDDPEFWIDIDNEIIRRGQIMKTIIPSKYEGYC